MTVRLETARDILRSSDFSIMDVALMVGFDNGSNLSDSYNHHFHIRPSLDRK